jgi:hypothetical protein
LGNRPFSVAHRLLLIAYCLSISFAPAARADSFDVIISGKGGEQEYALRFAEWGLRLKKVLVESLGHPAENVILLTDPPGDTPLDRTRPSRLEDIRKAIEASAARVTPRDNLFIYLIGHGSFQAGESKLNIDGPDLSAADLKSFLENIQARRVVVVNAASASAGFVNALSADGRIVCTSTRDVDERNATDFMEYFIAGLEDGSADQDRDERISILEAAQQAAALTAASYTGRGLLLTEHALIDDNGDGLGTRLPLGAADAPERGRAGQAAAATNSPLDGAAAASCYLKDFIFPPSVPKELVDAYLAALDEVEQLKRNKSQLEAADYRAQLETLLIKAARLNREIHDKL